MAKSFQKWIEIERYTTTAFAGLKNGWEELIMYNWMA